MNHYVHSIQHMQVHLNFSKDKKIMNVIEEINIISLPTFNISHRENQLNYLTIYFLFHYRFKYIDENIHFY